MCGTFLGEKWRKARKHHWCAACSVRIPRGFTYVVTTDADSGKVSSVKWHLECWEEFGRMLRREGEECGPPDWTWENGRPPPEVEARYFIGPLYPTDEQWEQIAP